MAWDDYPNSNPNGPGSTASALKLLSFASRGKLRTAFWALTRFLRSSRKDNKHSVFTVTVPSNNNFQLIHAPAMSS